MLEVRTPEARILPALHIYGVQFTVFTEYRISLKIIQILVNFRGRYFNPKKVAVEPNITGYQK